MNETNPPADNSANPQAAVEQPPPQLAAPVADTERFASVDVLRGFALLGILVINIDYFAGPSMSMFNPTLHGNFAGLNRATWIATTLLFNQKFMAIFSMLFGAGLVLMAERAAKRGVQFRSVYYTRVLWLLLIGLVHAYLIWYGDILVPYALCGLLLYPLRRLKPKWLITLGLIVFMVCVPVYLGTGALFDYMRTCYDEVEQAVAEEGEITPVQRSMHDAWEQISKQFETTDQTAKEIEARRGSWVDNLAVNALLSITMQTQAFIFFIFWRVMGLMLLGMGLMKLGVFSAQRSRGFYLTLIVIGYGLGLPAVAYGTHRLLTHNFDYVMYFKLDAVFDYVFSLLVSLGHIGVVMLVFKMGILNGLKRGLAAVGRMALSNYLFHSVVMTFIFFWWGLGLFADLGRFHLLAFVLVMWIVQLIISPIWLKHYRFGPAEWVWRSLTYRRRQPMRIIAAPQEP